MAGGPISPFPPYLGTNGNLFPIFITGTGGNASPTRPGIGVVASLAADSVAMLTFPIPPIIPTGTLKLMTRMLSLGNSGVAKLTISDGTAGNGADPSAITLHGEPQISPSFVGQAGKFVDTKTTLTTTPAGNDCVIIAATFNTTGWTLSSQLAVLFWLLWE